jgi:hypothetical protein
MNCPSDPGALGADITPPPGSDLTMANTRRKSQRGPKRKQRQGRDIPSMLERERELTERLAALRQAIGAAVRAERQRKNLGLRHVVGPAAIAGSDVSLLERGRVWNREKMERLAEVVLELPPEDPRLPGAA